MSEWRNNNQQHLRRYAAARQQAIAKICTDHYDEYLRVYDDLCAKAGVVVQTNMRRNVYGPPSKGRAEKTLRSRAEALERNRVLNRLRNEARNEMRRRYRDDHDRIVAEHMNK